jgi:uncharacterized protein YcbX
MLVTPEGKFITQRERPRLALVSPHYTSDQALLLVDAPGMEPLSVVPTEDGEQYLVEIWKDKPMAVDQGDVASKWFSRFLKTDCRLVAMPSTYVRQVSQKHAPRAEDEVGFADGYPILLITQASLSDLNTRLLEQEKLTVPMKRFRPNIVVSWTEPFAEDRWRRIRIGSLVFEVVKSCARCVMTATDQHTAEVGKEPLATLSQYRRSSKGDVMFGQNLTYSGKGVIHVGDTVEVLEASETANFLLRS